jgi:hypothetical protein
MKSEPEEEQKCSLTINDEVYSYATDFDTCYTQSNQYRAE